MDSFVTDVNDVLEYIKSYRLCERIYSLQKHNSWLEADIRCCLIDKKREESDSSISQSLS